MLTCPLATPYLCTGCPFCMKCSAHIFCQTNVLFKTKLRYHLLEKAFSDFFRESYLLPLLCFWSSIHTPQFFIVCLLKQISTFFSIRFLQAQDSARHIASIKMITECIVGDSPTCEILLTALNTHR